MGQPRIIEVNYHDFLNTLRQATDSKNNIDISDKERWMGFVRKHKVPEAGMKVKAKAGGMSGNIKAVIIDGAGTADGYYAYAPDDQFCIKHESGLE